ncbi:MAG: hypothetical protein ACLRVN_09695 [Butyricicoccus sp.]
MKLFEGASCPSLGKLLDKAEQKVSYRRTCRVNSQSNIAAEESKMTFSER